MHEGLNDKVKHQLLTDDSKTPDAPLSRTSEPSQQNNGTEAVGQPGSQSSCANNGDSIAKVNDSAENET